MAQAMDLAGNHLLALPDGEIGEKSDDYPQGHRAAWIHTIVDACERDRRAWTVLDPGRRGANGFAVDYQSLPRLRPKFPPSTMHLHLNFGWTEFFARSYPEFKRLREQRGRPQLPFQVGLPTGLGVTYGMMSPVMALRYAGAFNRRMAIEANRILDEADPGDIVFQLEVPAELALAYRLPKWLHALVVRGVLDLLRQIRPQARFGVHLCFGDLNNEAIATLGTLDKAVSFTNALLARWPATHTLQYVHFPLAAAAEPPPRDRSFYAPLAALELPSDVRFVSGFVHEARDEAALRRLRAIVDEHMGRTVDIASPCGLGRRTPEVARRLIETAVALARD